MKIFDIDRTLPRYDKKQFKSVEELLEYFKLNYLIEFEFDTKRRMAYKEADSYFYYAMIEEAGHTLKYILTVVVADGIGLVSWKVEVKLTVGACYNTNNFWDN